MSHVATKWAFDQPELHRDMKPSEWAVLMVLADCHNPVNGCFPSQDYICSKTNLGERTVRDQLARLRGRQLVNWEAARENDRRASNRYSLAFEPDFLPADSAGSPSGEIEHEQPAESDQSNRQNLPPNLVREPVKEPVSEKPARATTPKSELETVLSPERAQAVIDHRQRMRKPVTAYAAQLLAGKFRMARDPDAAADAMIANGWQGFDVEWMESAQRGRGPPAVGSYANQPNGRQGHAARKRSSAELAREIAATARDRERDDRDARPPLLQLPGTGRR
jgi:hypothetical protein